MSLVKIFHFVLVRLGLRDRLRAPDTSVWCQERFAPQAVFPAVLVPAPHSCHPHAALSVSGLTGIHNWSWISHCGRNRCTSQGAAEMLDWKPLPKKVPHPRPCRTSAPAGTPSSAGNSSHRRKFSAAFAHLFLCFAATSWSTASPWQPEPAPKKGTHLLFPALINRHYPKVKSYLRLASARINNPRSFYLVTRLQFVCRDRGVPPPAAEAPPHQMALDGLNLAGTL